MAKNQMLKDESSLLKSMMIRIDDNHILLVTQQYHTELNDQGKTDRSKSKYRWLARVFTDDSLKDLIKTMYDDANRLNRFRWPNDPDPWYICVGNDSTNAIGANWLSMKLKKLRTWEDGLKFLDGWQTETKKREAGYNLAAKYETEDYLMENGEKISLKDKDALLKCVDQNLYKPQIMKSKIKSSS
jgi:hypothetical protein